MGIVELCLIAVGVSMDAFAVAVCKGMESRRATLRQALICGVWFGVFQGMMPFIGYLLSSRLSAFIEPFSAWLAFFLLSFLGINMLREAFSSDDEEETGSGFGFKTMFTLAVATSIDALAVGITFVAVPPAAFPVSPMANTVFACLLICVVTFLFSSVGVRIGNVFGMRFKSGAVSAGGFVLVFIGLKILLEHLGILEKHGSDVLLGLLIPFLGTVLGAALVYVLDQETEHRLKGVLEGMAGGIMLACSMWTMLYPSVLEGRVHIAVGGFIMGIAFQLLLDKSVPHTHVFTSDEEGPASSLQHAHKVMLAELIHHVPEGMAIGVMFAAFLTGTGKVTLASAMALTIGIAVQNIPEGAFVSSPLFERGEEKKSSFLYGVLSGIVEPVMGILTIILCSVFPGIVFFVMALTGGALTYLVIEEVIPAMSTGGHSDKGTVSFAVFFSLMMILTFYVGH